MGSRSDVTPFLEACYAEAASDDRWGTDVVAGFCEAFRFFDEVALYVATCDVAADAITPTVIVSPPAWRPMIEAIRSFSLREYQGALFPGKLVATTSDLAVCLPRSEDAYWHEQRSTAGIADGIAVVVHPAPATAIVLFGHGSGMRLGRHVRGVLARAALHLESAFRLRIQHGAVRAVIGADGSLVDGALSGGEHARLASATRGAEAARSTRDLGLWTALVAGHLSVVPRMRGSRRVYELVENARAARPVHALSRREVDVLELAATGLSTKLCSYALGLSPTTISTTLTNAARKLGALGQLELLRIAALLTHDPRADADEATLTAAERDILALVRDGLSNAEIAARRGRSVRTIANQVASLLRKTGRPSRRALIAA